MSRAGDALGRDDVDALFALPPAEFTAARDAVVRRLRAEGHRDDAAAVKALRRPTVVAWAINQLARHHPAEVAELAALADRAATAQDRALAGDRDELRAVDRDRRTVLRDLARLADVVLAGRGGAHRDEVVAALTAAAADPATATALRAGRLSEPPVASGFAAAFAAGLPEPGDPAPGPETPTGAAAASDDEAAAVEARRVAEDAAALAAEAGATAARLRSEAAAAAAHVGELERQLDAARAEEAAAAARAAAAVEAADELARAAHEAAGAAGGSAGRPPG